MLDPLSRPVWWTCCPTRRAAAGRLSGVPVRSLPAEHGVGGGLRPEGVLRGRGQVAQAGASGRCARVHDRPTHRPAVVVTTAPTSRRPVTRGVRPYCPPPVVERLRVIRVPARSR